MRALVVLLAALLAAPASAGEPWRDTLLGTVMAVCAGPRGSDDELQTRLPGGVTITNIHSQSRTGTPFRFTMEVDFASGEAASLRVDGGGADHVRISAMLYDAGNRPLAQMRAGRQGTPQCTVTAARLLQRDAAGKVQAVVTLDAALADTDERLDLNPPVPPGAPDTPGIRIAHIDSGVNYLLPDIADRLARDGDGAILGYDFRDDDATPFDLDFGRSPFFPIRHGTAVASVILSEAPDAALVPLRFPRHDMTKMGDVVRHAVAAGARVIAMPMGSNDPDDWATFLAAARTASDVLFVVSAGNAGISVDASPQYPAVSELPNMLVVTSADDFGRLARGSNWGPDSVDLLVPAEGLDVMDHRGATVQASGSSYAVPRVAALAARLLAANPDWTAPDLIAAIAARAVPGMDRGAPRVRIGWLPDPAAD